MIPAATTSGGCLAFTATPTSRPSVSELEGFRYKMGEPAGQFGECRKAKDSVYGESACLTPHESKGHADGKGKYEWYRAEAGVCFGQKKGEFGEGACKQVEQKKGKPDGKYELAKGPSRLRSAGRCSKSAVKRSNAAAGPGQAN